MSPEQALSAEFKKVLRTPGFHDRFGMFAIDELHMVAEWGKEFREDYALIHELRSWPTLNRRG